MVTRPGENERSTKLTTASTSVTFSEGSVDGEVDVGPDDAAVVVGAVDADDFDEAWQATAPSEATTVAIRARGRRGPFTD